MRTNGLSPSLPRLQSVDCVRGIAMVLMAVDHIRDFIDHRAMLFSPTNLARTSAPLFLTRWVTHFCAPVFILTAGLSAFLWMSRGHHSKSELSRYLATRGLFLILLELTVVRLIMFSAWPFTRPPVLLIILWAIGVSMIALAVLAHLPVRALALVSLTVIACHNLLDAVPAARFGPLAWFSKLLHQPGAFSAFGITFISAYPVLPWIAVIALGFCLGHTYRWNAKRRLRSLQISALVMIACFLVLRLINRYGDPVPWSTQVSRAFTVLSFLNVSKYPPSMDFLLMTIGSALLALALVEPIRLSERNPPHSLRPRPVVLLCGPSLSRALPLHPPQRDSLRLEVVCFSCTPLYGEPVRNVPGQLWIFALGYISGMDLDRRHALPALSLVRRPEASPA